MVLRFIESGCVEYRIKIDPLTAPFSAVFFTNKKNNSWRLKVFFVEGGVPEMPPFFRGL